uniref:Uncharacterized protein n=1 Tax=Zea mays TaxID=4577 RepID=B6SLQ5_MAIZE|nr:hypothetical protein [Zea mays]ACG29913.1 hypothetical protein [Zea mays]
MLLLFLCLPTHSMVLLFSHACCMHASSLCFCFCFFFLSTILPHGHCCMHLAAWPSLS